MRASRLWSSVSGVVLAVHSWSAHAQSAPAQPEAAAPAEAATPDPNAADIVVTGSRISRRDLVAATPILTSTQEALQQSGAVNLEAAINQMPQFTPAGGANSGGRGASQRATLNLRGLGTQRNLVLMDGRRLPPSDPNGVPDINNIPSAIIEGVETITGGASAIYGSDAISGVVNFKTKRNFEGVQVDLQYGNTFKSDRYARDVSVTIGGNFADKRGNIVVSFGYSDRQRLPGYKRALNDFGRLSSFLGYGAYAAAATNLPSAAAVSALFNTKYGIAGTTSTNNNFGINDNGTLFTVNGARNYKGITSGDYIITADGTVRYPVARYLDALSAQTRKSFFGKAHYDLTPSVTLYAQALVSNPSTDKSDGTSITQFGTLNTVPVTNPFIPADLKTLLASRPNPSARFDLNTRYSGFPDLGWTDELNTTQFIGGLRGNVGIKDWTFDAFGQVDRTLVTQTQRNGIIKSKIQQLLDSPTGGTNLCAGGYNPFGNVNALNVSQACIDFATTSLKNSEDIRQTIFEASTQGTLFELPAGDLKFSLVADHRVNEYTSTPDFLLRDAGTIEAVNVQTATHGKIWVSEIAGELLVPVLRETPFAKSLNVGLAYRYSHYNLSGGSSTYKVDADWTVVDGLMFRAGYASAVRAPNVGELYRGATAGGAGGVGSPPSGGEPCDVRSNARINGGSQLRQLCIATGIPANIVDTYTFPTMLAASITQGNPNLKPETATTLTAGIVWQSRFNSPLLRHLSFSIDYYDIKVKDVISSVGPSVLSKCYNLDGSNPSYDPASIYCKLVHRDANGQLTLIEAPQLNLGGLRRRGIDIAGDWRYDIGPGTFKANVVASIILQAATQDFPTNPFQDFVDTNGNPDWASLATFGYEWGPAELSVRWRHIDATKDPTSVTRPASPSPGTGAYNLFDLVGSYQILHNVELRGGITNVLDQDPLVTGGVLGQTDTGLYDILGRSYYVALRAKF